MSRAATTQDVLDSLCRVSHTLAEVCEQIGWEAADPDPKWVRQELDRLVQEGKAFVEGDGWVSAPPK